MRYERLSRCVLNSAHKNTILTDEEVCQTKQTLLKLSHRLRMQIPMMFILGQRIHRRL